MSHCVFRSVILALALLAPIDGRAQAPDSVAWERFWPMAAGDSMQFRWVYHVGSTGGQFYDTVYVNVSIAPDTLIEGVPFTHLVQVSDPHRADLTGHCAVRPVDAGWFVRDTVAGQPFACVIGTPSGPGNWVFGADVPRDPETINIGGMLYVVDAVNVFGFGFSGNWHNYRFAADIGYLAFYQGGFSGSHAEDRRYELMWARVSGAEYGQPVVVSSGPSAGVLPDVPTASVLPNPAGASAVVLLGLPGRSAARLDVADLLGRTLFSRELPIQPAGSSRHALDLSRLAGGIYILRVVTHGGSFARPFVRAD